MDRNKSMFNNPLISDISFAVRNDDDFSVTIPAHKYVLAISSPVFLNLFYGSLKEERETIELSDCKAECFLEFLRYVYYDEVHLTGNSAMQVLYLAKKYMVLPLEEKCSSFLEGYVNGANVLEILPQAMNFDEQNLVKCCWEIIDNHTHEALKSDSFLSMEKRLLKSLLERETLNVQEIDIFHAVESWAVKECERQGLNAKESGKRHVLGDEIVRLIRFPIMLQKDFAKFVADSKILTVLEFVELFKYFSDVNLMPSPGFCCEQRKPKSIIQETCKRFKFVHEPCDWWAYSSGTPDSIKLSVNHPINLLGVRLFGSRGGRYSVDLQLHKDAFSSRLAHKEGSFAAEAIAKDGYYGYDVMFDQSVLMEANCQYKIQALIHGPTSYYGEYGGRVSQTDHTRFTFWDDYKTIASNGTGCDKGQFAEFYFSSVL